jgi:hypothetical protein
MSRPNRAVANARRNAPAPRPSCAAPLGRPRPRRLVLRAAQPRPSDGRSRRRRNAAAPPDLVTLHIDSDVPGAQVFVDRQFIGAAP